jgi:hypothetical protein
MPLLTDTRETRLDEGPDEQVRRLEELWEASPEAPPARTERAAGRRRILGPALALGWLVFVVSVFFEPAPEPGAVTPLWGEYLILSFWLALGAAAIMGFARFGRGAYAAATIAGALGMGLAVACRTTEHHLGWWWAYELGATSALAAAGAVGLLRSRRRAQGS